MVLWLGLTVAQTLGLVLNQTSTIDACLQAAGCPTDDLGSDDWNNDVSPYNPRLSYTPVAIAVPTTTEHVQAAVSCAVKLGIKVSAKSGGHSYTSLGFGGEDGHLIVEMDRMYNVMLDNTTNIATVQAGTRLGHLATVLYNQGQRAIAHGTCPG
jgi:FAD/FMN-containing dehydrogenase